MFIKNVDTTNFFLKCRETGKNLAFLPRYNPPSDCCLQHLSTKVLHLDVPLMMSAPQNSSKMLRNWKMFGEKLLKDIF